MDSFSFLIADTKRYLIFAVSIAVGILFSVVFSLLSKKRCDPGEIYGKSAVSLCVRFCGQHWLNTGVPIVAFCHSLCRRRYANAYHFEE